MAAEDRGKPGRGVPHFREAGRIDPVGVSDRMPEAAYSTALDYLVIACVDIVFSRGDQVLLARRNQFPNPSWWIIGGRMIAGEDPRQTAQRKAAEEANLIDLAIDRFRYIGTYSTGFARRSQPPQQHGSHTVNITYQLELTSAEADQITLLSSEYDTWAWVCIDQVQQLPDLQADAGQMGVMLLRVIQDAAGVMQAGASPQLP